MTIRQRILRWIGIALALSMGVPAVLWAAGALFYDLPAPASIRKIAAIVWLLTAGILCFFVRPRSWARAAALLGFLIILGWWFTLRPSNDRVWQPDVAQTGWAEVNGDEVTLHNVRNCDYRTETDYTPHWETRTVRLSQITGLDLAINFWGSPWMAHPIARFQFADTPPVCFSIETRKEVGESYSAIGGIYRQFELIYIVADERDVVRVRTNYRTGEDVYLYHLQISPEHARQRFLEYVAAMNHMRDHPRWYNAITTNCTTSIRTQHNPNQRRNWDWRILLNGKADEMLYENGALKTGGLPFAELKQRSLVNSAARAANADPEFSRRLREALPVQ